MKKTLLFIASILFALGSYGQSNGGCIGNSQYPYNIDSTNFSDTQTNHFFYEIDANFSNNLWQVGPIQKRQSAQTLPMMADLQLTSPVLM